MSFLKIFSSKNKAKQELYKQQKVFFGQYAGLEKSNEQCIYFEKSIHSYKKHFFLDAFEYFFLYLKNTDTENLAFNKDKSKIEFSLIQGSKIIRGFINEQDIYAEAEIVRFPEPEIPVMNKLLQENYFLRYCKFAIKNNIYSLKFYGITADTNPESLYSALLEMSIYADKYDDLLINEFKNLKPVNINHIHQIAGKKLNLRLNYLKNLFEDILNINLEYKNLNERFNIRLKLLNKLYATDYLTAPGGKLKNQIRTLIDNILQTNDKESNELNKSIKNKIAEIINSNDDELKKDLQYIIKTFPEKEITSLQEIKKYIETNLNKAITYLDENLFECSELILENILGELTYKFGLSPNQEKILWVLWQYYHLDFFRNSGFEDIFFGSTIQFNEKLIKEYINKTQRNTRKNEQKLNFNVEKLKFEGKYSFLISFLAQFANAMQY